VSTTFPTPPFQPQPPRPAPFLRGYAIAGAFLMLAAWFVWGPMRLDIPNDRTPEFDRRILVTQPPREALLQQPSVVLAGYRLNCMECHRIFRSAADTPSTLMQHQHIHLDHGLNNRCLNCHDRDNRERLALRDGSNVAFGEVVLLCAGCHGPNYRDWLKGMHGRTNGYWNASLGTMRRLICTECHDPHAPAFKPMTPLPGPHTLRLNPDERPVHEVFDEVNPLRKWKSGEHAAKPSGASAPAPLGDAHAGGHE